MRSLAAFQNAHHHAGDSTSGGITASVSQNLRTAIPPLPHPHVRRIQRLLRDPRSGRDASADEIKKAFRKLARKHHPDVAKDKTRPRRNSRKSTKPTKCSVIPRNGRNMTGSAPTGRMTDNSASRLRGTAAAGVSLRWHRLQRFLRAIFQRWQPLWLSRRMPSGARRGPPRRAATSRATFSSPWRKPCTAPCGSISLQMTAADRQNRNPHFPGPHPAGRHRWQTHPRPRSGRTRHGGGAAGDLYLRVRHAAHPDFTTGRPMCSMNWKSPHGKPCSARKFRCHTRWDGQTPDPAGSENGQQLRVRGRGLPKGKTGERGDFHAVLSVQFLESERRGTRSLGKTPLGFPLQSNPSPAMNLPLYEPDEQASYTLDIVSEITGISSQTILHYQEAGLIPPTPTTTKPLEPSAVSSICKAPRRERIRTRPDSPADG